MRKTLLSCFKWLGVISSKHSVAYLLDLKQENLWIPSDIRLSKHQCVVTAAICPIVCCGPILSVTSSPVLGLRVVASHVCHWCHWCPWCHNVTAVSMQLVTNVQCARCQVARHRLTLDSLCYWHWQVGLHILKTTCLNLKCCGPCKQSPPGTAQSAPECSWCNTQWYLIVSKVSAINATKIILIALFSEKHSPQASLML